MAKKKFKLRWFHFVGAIVLVFVILWAISSSRTKETEVTTETAQKRSIKETVSASGKIQPEIEVKIGSEITGEIVDLLIKEGDSVKKGDLLLRINPDLLQSDQQRNVANMNNAKANLANAKARLAQQEARFKTEIIPNYKRSKSLYEKRVISEYEWQQVEANYQAAQQEIDALRAGADAAAYSVRASEATVNQSNKNLLRTEIYATMNGIISKLSVEKGERVAGVGTVAGVELLRIADLSSIILKVEVSENDILKISRGDTATIDIDAYPNRKFKGLVYEMANSPLTTAGQTLTTDQVSNFQVKIRLIPDSYADLLTLSKQPFRSGMSGSAEIETDERKGVITVSIEAVVLREDEGKDSSKQAARVGEDTRRECVFINNKGVAKMMYVTTGIQDSKYIEIKTGVDEKAEVITGPYNVVSRTLKNGEKIKVNKNAFDVKKKLKKQE